MKKAGFLAAIAAAAAILLQPQTAVACAQQAMRLWYGSVAPSLFPFLALMPLLTGPEARAVYSKMFAPAMDRLFRLPGSAAPAIVVGMISGSPGGALAFSRIAAGSNMKIADLRRTAPVVCGLGPAYLIMAVGVGLFGSREFGLKLAAAQLLAQILLLLGTPFFFEDSPDTVPNDHRELPVNGVRDAAAAVITVCGYMVLFSVVAGVFSEFLGQTAGTVLLILSDLPSGMSRLAQWSFPMRNLAVGMAVGFGGFCVAAQNMDVLRNMGLRWRDFLVLKFAQSALTGSIFALIAREKPTGITFALPDSTAPYAFSLLIALLLCCPVLIYLSNKLFLNKRKPGDILST